MLRVETVKSCLWRNLYAPHPVLLGTVFFGDAFAWTTDRLSPPVRSVLNETIDGMSGAGALNAADLVAHVAQHIQRLGDRTEFSPGVASRDAAKREATLFFSAKDSFIAPRCLSLAVQIVDRLVQSDVGAKRLSQMFKSCAEMIDANALEPRTREMIAAAERQGIPWFRTSSFLRHVQLGQGARQRRFWNTMFSSEPAFARDYADNKLLTLNTLSQIKLPVGKFAPVNDIASALKAAEGIGYPVVLKPTNGSKGDSVFVDLRDEDELKAALIAARVSERPYMLQSFFQGNDYRLLVVDGKLLMAEQRIPASIKGDGKRTIAELVEIENRNPERTRDDTMTSIVLDWESDRMLTRQGYTRDTVVPAGSVVRLKGMANIATGGAAVTINDVHPDNARLAVRAARAIGLVVTGVDFICPDISKSWHEVGGGLCEVNATVGLPDERMTPGIDLRRAIVQGFYPEGDDGRIPTAMVTGTFGKTTTTLMLTSILSSAGHTVGCATTEAVRIGEEDVAHGDSASADGASIVLRDATVTAAVLETARGGLIKTGMYLDHCDVSALLNVGREQIDMDGVATLDDMAALKRKVLDAARKAVVLNADDPRCLALAPEFTKKLRTFLFSRDSGSPAISDHTARGGDALFLAATDGHETIMVASGSDAIPLLRTADIPATRNGLFWQQSMNAMAAAALAIGLGVDRDAIREGLRRYGKAFRAASCRLAVDDDIPVATLFDFAVSPPGFAAAITVTDAMPVSGTRFCVATVVGNRPDWIFPESAAALAGHFGRYVFFELEDYRKGRKPGEITARLSKAVLAAGVDPKHVSVVDTYADAASLVAREAKPGDLIVVFGADKPADIEQYRAAFRDARW